MLTIIEAMRPAAAYAFHNAQSFGSYILYPEGMVFATLITPSSSALSTSDAITVPTVPFPFSFTRIENKVVCV